MTFKNLGTVGNRKHTYLRRRGGKEGKFVEKEEEEVEKEEETEEGQEVEVERKKG